MTNSILISGADSRGTAIQRFRPSLTGFNTTLATGVSQTTNVPRGNTQVLITANGVWVELNTTGLITLPGSSFTTTSRKQLIFGSILVEVEAGDAINFIASAPAEVSLNFYQ